MKGGLQVWICIRETQSIVSLQNFRMCKYLLLNQIIIFSFSEMQKEFSPSAHRWNNGDLIPLVDGIAGQGVLVIYGDHVRCQLL